MPASPPDLSSRPLRMTVEHLLKTTPALLYKAWTEQLDTWLAAPGTVLMSPKADTAFYFETHHGTLKLPYYGRFIKLVKDQRIEMTWLSTGTKYLETVIIIELTPTDSGTRLVLTQAGFPDESSRHDHEQAWPHFLQILDDRLK